MKLTKAQLTEMVREVIREQLRESSNERTLKGLYKTLEKDSHKGPMFHQYMYVDLEGDTIKVEPSDPYDFSDFEVNIPPDGPMTITSTPKEGKPKVVHQGPPSYRTALQYIGMLL